METLFQPQAGTPLHHQHLSKHCDIPRCVVVTSHMFHTPAVPYILELCGQLCFRGEFITGNYDFVAGTLGKFRAASGKAHCEHL